MIKTRFSLSTSGSSKLLLDKMKMKKIISEYENEDLSDGSDGSGDVYVKEVKRKQYNRGNKKVTDDRPLKKLKQVVEYDEDLYDSDDLEVENNESMKLFSVFSVVEDIYFVYIREWELYFKHDDMVGGRIIFFPNHENNFIANINSKLTPSQAKLFRERCFGHFLDMNPIAMKTQLIHNALLREVHQKNPSEMWFKFGSQNFRFSLVEFVVVTDLLCVGESDMSAYEKKENAFMDKYFSDQQVTVSAVEERFRYSDFKLDEYVVKMAVFPNSKKVLNEILNIVGIGDYESFPWGKLLKGEYIFPTDEERSMLNLFGFEFIEKEGPDVDRFQISDFIIDDLVIKDVDYVGLVTENVKDYPIFSHLYLLGSLQDAGDGGLINEGHTALQGDGLQDVGDGGLVNEGHTALQFMKLS
ncbi:hypothetical protein G4B88_007402 [Cannabis sativa]|uniref:DUF1985 domain-containing protein n=1 Tax=Cannabis sativa TaxID=3483 RepID=A0A7J6DRC4_CANSA|nr:hypothetical protein G4B88_007402 [Cannabis sativa]